MNGFFKLQEPFLYQVQGSYQFVICREMQFNPVSMQTVLRGDFYSYENEDLVCLQKAEVIIDGQENQVIQMDEEWNYVD